MASPFFSPSQLEVVKRLEQVLDPYAEVYSPRRDGGVLGPNSSHEDRRAMFDLNYQKIAGCHIMVAQIESLDTRPQMIATRALGSAGGEFNRPVVEALDKYLPNYTDIGTVWEMGAAYAANVPVIAFSPNPGRQMNLMLSESVRGFTSKYEELIDAIETILNGGQYGRHEGTIQ